MSRIGRQPIKIPENVEVKISDGFISVRGPKGEVSRQIHDSILLEKNGAAVLVKPRNESKKNLALWGTFRSLINNMVKGVSDGFQKVLIYEGIGYKSEVKNDTLELNVGFTHPVRVIAPKGIDFKVEKNQITVSGADKELVGQVGANIRKIRPPEPYKGKGIRYKDEVIIRKAGKKAVTAG